MVADKVKVSTHKAKALFLQLGYGGGVDSWCSDHGVSPNDLPQFVFDFATEQAEIRDEDAQRHTELFAKIRAYDPSGQPEATLQSYLHMRKERNVLDAMERAAHGIARVASYEHDGLFLVIDDIDPDDEAAGRAWQREVLERVRARVAAPVSIKEPPHFDEVLAELAAKFPGDWTGTDSLEQGAKVAMALRHNCYPSPHETYA